MRRFRTLLSMMAVMLFTAAMAQNPIVHWRFANPVVYDDQGVCTLEFDIEMSCDMAGTFHSDLQVYFDYNTLAFGENVVSNNVLTYERLPLLQGDLAGTPLYAIFGNVDNKPYRYAILSEATFTVPNPMFMNEVPLLPTFGGYIKVKMIILDQNELAGIAFVDEDGGVGLMNGGQYYLDATHPTATKYGNPPNYEGVYENDLLTQPLSCGGATEWTGAVDEDWFDPANWTAGVPTGAVDALIPNLNKAPYPVILSGSATVATLVISSGAALTLDYDADLTATGPFYNWGLFTINCDTIPVMLPPDTIPQEIGSFIDNGTIIGDGEFRMFRYLYPEYPFMGCDPINYTDFGWHLVSSPINNGVTGEFMGYFVKRWNDTTNLYVDIDPFTDPVPPGVVPPIGGPSNSWLVIPLDTLTGYSVKLDWRYLNSVNPSSGSCYDVIPPLGETWHSTERVIEFKTTNINSWYFATNPLFWNNNNPMYPVIDTPSFFTGPLSIDLTNVVTGGVYDNWNLLGNPYPSSIDWELVTIPPQMANSVYYWDDTAFVYKAYVQGVGGPGSQFIPPTQGFFVEVLAPGGKFMVNNNVRTHSGKTLFYKNTPENLVIINSSGNGFRDEAWISFNENATSGFDPRYDAHKMFSEVGLVPQIYTSGTGGDLQVNSCPATDMIPLGFKTGNTGVYTIAAHKTGNFETVYLEDLKTGILHNLESPYEFTYVEGDDANRFIIHFGPINTSGAENGLLVYSHMNNIYVYNENNLKGDVYVYTVMGQEVAAIELQDGLNIIRMNDVHSYYVVKVLAGNALVNKKVYIR